MGHKVDIPEVKDFTDDLQEASADIRSSLDNVQESIEAIDSMSSFSGKAAKEAKQYFGELHVTILESFRGLFDDLEENLQQHLKTFRSDVDSSDSAVIKSSYLQDVKEDVNELFDDLTKQDEIIHDTIQEVTDISSAIPPSFSDVDEWKKKAIKKLKEVDEDLSSFNNKGDETNVKAVMNQIETSMNNAQTSEGKARFADFEGASDGSALAKLADYNEYKKKTEEEKIENLNDKSKSYLKQVEEDYKTKKIDKATYESIRLGIIENGTSFIKSAGKNKLPNFVSEQVEEEVAQWGNKIYEEEKIEKLDDKSQSYLKQVEEDYKTKKVDKATYESIRSGIIENGTSFIKNASDEKVSGPVSGQVKKAVSQWANQTYEEYNIVSNPNDPEHGYLVGEDVEHERGTLSAGAGYYENDWKKQDQVGGTNTVSLIHVGSDLDTDIVDGDFHQDVLKGESTTQIGGSSVWGLNVPLPLAKVEGKGYELQGRAQFDDDLAVVGGYGVEGKGDILKGKAYGGFDNYSVGFAAKTSLAEGDASGIIPIPFTDTDMKVTIGGSAGSIGGEAKIGKESMLDLRALIGVKLGLKFE